MAFALGHQPLETEGVLAVGELIHWKDAPAGDAADLKGGGGGGTYDPMEARVKALEDRFEKMDGKLDAIVKDLADIKAKVANLPTAWQIIGICATLIALVIGSSGGLLAILRFLTP